MKTKFTLLLVLLVFGLRNFAQVWTVQPSGITTILRDVFFISPANGWAVGDQGVILATTDGGSSWSVQNSTVGSVSLASVFFTSPTKGWIAGSSATILTTDNGGTTWTVVSNTPASQIIYNDIYFTDPDTGYFVGSNILAGTVKSTTNGGGIWQTASLSNGLNAVHFTSGSLGWACGSRGVIFNTDDAGGTWVTQKAAGANQTFNVSCIYMVSETEGWVGGNPSTFFYTTDGGLNWNNKASGTNAGKTEVHFLNSQTGWAVTTSSLGGDYPIRHTIDGGTNWVVDTNFLPTMYGLTFYSDTLGFMVGESGKILRYGTPSITLGATELTACNHINTYPNPVYDFLMINCNEPIDNAEIYSMTGQLVMLVKGETTGIDVSQLTPGSYSLKLTTSHGKQQVKRFLKSN